MITGTHSARLLRKTKPNGRHPQKALSPAFVRSAPPGRHADGNGLYLFVQPSGTRSSIQRLLIRGRRRELGLGSVALVPLAEAREKALAFALAHVVRRILMNDWARYLAQGSGNAVEPAE